MGPITRCCRSNKHREELNKNFDGLDKEEIDEVESLIMGQDIAYELDDHASHGDDVTSVKNYDQLDPYQKFEKEYPFFRMDVNGFCLHVREAMMLDL